jgi:hypothetical protein
MGPPRRRLRTVESAVRLLPQLTAQASTCPIQVTAQASRLSRQCHRYDPQAHSLTFPSYLLLLIGRFYIENPETGKLKAYLGHPKHRFDPYGSMVKRRHWQGPSSAAAPARRLGARLAALGGSRHS